MNMGLTEKMTELADMVRGIRGISEKLSIDDMTEEIRSVPQCRQGFSELETAMLSGEGSGLSIVDDTVTYVREYAFYEVKGISSVEFRKVEKAGKYAFRYCPDLHTISFPNMQKAPYQLLIACDNIRKVSMPNCEEVYISALYGMDNLVEVELPKCRILSETAMLKCISLEEINLPVCEFLGRSAFEGCVKLKKVIAPKLNRIDRDCFREAATDYVDILGEGSISERAFWKSGIKALVIRGTNKVMWLGNINAFTGSPVENGTGFIYVPASLLDAYKTAQNWSVYASQILPIECSEYEIKEGTV